MWSMGCIEKSACPADAVGSTQTNTTVGGPQDGFQSQILTCSYFHEPTFDGERKKAIHCGEIGNLVF